MFTRIRHEWHRPLIVNAAFTAGLFAVAAVGLLVDDRTLLGEPIWVKPLKFGFAFAVYGLTLAWMLSKLRKAKRFGWWMGTIHAVFTTLDVAAIAAQAARGTFSHFNTELDDPVNGVILGVLTYGVPPVLLVNLVIAVLLLVQRVGDRAMTIALRVGLGAAVFAMTVPFWLAVGDTIEAREVTDANGDQVTMYIGHGVGDPDGTGMPLTNWSVTGGDMRVPHFVGLHGIHVLLLLVAVLTLLSARVTWLRAEQTRARLVAVAASGYLGLLATVTWQARRAQSLIHPDAATLTAFATVAALTAIAAAVVVLAARTRTFRHS